MVIDYIILNPIIGIKYCHPKLFIYNFISIFLIICVNHFEFRSHLILIHYFQASHAKSHLVRNRSYELPQSSLSFKSLRLDYIFYAPLLASYLLLGKFNGQLLFLFIKVKLNDSENLQDTKSIQGYNSRVQISKKYFIGKLHNLKNSTKIISPWLWKYSFFLLDPNTIKKFQDYILNICKTKSIFTRRRTRVAGESSITLPPTWLLDRQLLVLIVAPESPILLSLFS